MTYPEINFIPNDDFQSASEDDFEKIDFELYAEEERGESLGRRKMAESFLGEIQACRLLTYEGEQLLFKKLNFLRFRAHALQSTQQGKKKSRKALKEINRLLKTASETREQIVRANLRLILSISRKLSQSQDDLDEFLAEANTILLKSIDKFDYARGYRFSTYVTHAVQRHLYRYMNRRQKQKQRETCEESPVLGAVAPLIDENEPTEKEILEAFEGIMSRIEEVLDQREQYIVRERFGIDNDGKTKSMRIIGEELGISKERTRQVFQKSIEKLVKVAKPFAPVFGKT